MRVLVLHPGAMGASIAAAVSSAGHEVIGVAKPQVAYRETRTEKEWTVILKLPGHFDRIEVVGGTYRLAPDGTIVMTFKEKKRDYLPYAVVAAVLGAALGFW